MSGLLQKKLKVFSAGPAATVSVFQDGDAADGDATSGYQFDDAFSQGAQRPDTTSRADREWIELRTLSSSYDEGKTLVFALRGRHAFMDTAGVTVRLQPNDRVELWAEVPTTDAGVDTPDWHLNGVTAGTQTRLFYGFVEECRATPDGGVEATCRDAMRKADDLILSRAGTSTEVPKLVFNPENGDPDFYWGVKVTTGTTVTYGESAAERNRASIKQILEWLWTEYEAELVGLGVVESGTDLFHADDLALLTQKPGPLVFERTGFGQAVREIMAWAPDKRIVVDHATGQWRFVQWGAALKSDQGVVFQHFHVGSGGYEDAIRIPSPSQTYFSATPGADGNRVRIYDLTDPTKNEEFTIHSIVYVGVVGGDYELRTNEKLKHQVYQNASKLYPVRNTAMPTLTLPVDDATRIELSRDLQGAYSAVNLYSIHQNTETVNDAWQSGAVSPRLAPAWNTGFDQYWKDKDAHREADWGADSLGLKVHKIATVSGRDALYVRYEDSAYGDDHAMNEWQGVTLWVWTKDGGTDAKAAKHVFTVYSQGSVADVGDGKPGMSILLVGTAGDFAAAVGDFDFDGGTDIGSPAGSDVDRVVLTSDMQFTTTTAHNRRSVVGKLWYIDDTDVRGATSGYHAASCDPPKLQYDTGYGGVQRVSTLDAGNAYPPTNWRSSGDFDYVGGGGIGSTLIWKRKSVRTEKPVAAACGGQPGYAPPNNLLATTERTTTTARSARFPASGHAGHAYAAYNLSRVLHVPVDPWTTDDQDEDFEALAERLWDAHQNAHHRGTISFVGLRAHATWLDLAVRVTPTTERAPFDSSAAVEGFWGPLTSLTLNFTDGTVEYGFDSAAALAKLLDDTYFALFKKYATPAYFRGWHRRNTQMIQCVAGATHDPNVSALCAGSVYTPGGRPLPPVIGLPAKDNEANGIAESAIGLAETGGAAASGGGGKLSTHGGTATATVVTDVDGGAFAVGGRGEIFAVDVTGNMATPSASASYGPRSKIDRTEDEVEGHSAMFGGMQLGHQQYRDIYARTNAGSTTTVIEVKAPVLPVVADATGWTLHILDFLDREPREAYDVDSIAADAITLASAITDDAGAPLEDVRVILIPPRKPLPDPSDFTLDGSYGFQDDAGDWYVFEPNGSTGTVYRATLVGNLLEKVASGSGTLSLKVGPTAGNANIAVEVDFTGTTVVGTSGSEFEF